MTERKRIEVTGFDDWTESVKAEVIVFRPEGDMVIPIYAVSEADRVKIIDIYQELKPARPNLVLDKKTHEPRYTAMNDNAELEYAKKKRYAAAVVQMLYIEKGCRWTIPGKDNEEKLASLGKKVSGEIDRLETEILALSRLTNEDVNFFSKG